MFTSPHLASLTAEYEAVGLPYRLLIQALPKHPTLDIDPALLDADESTSIFYTHFLGRDRRAPCALLTIVSDPSRSPTERWIPSDVVLVPPKRLHPIVRAATVLLAAEFDRDVVGREGQPDCDAVSRGDQLKLLARLGIGFSKPNDYGRDRRSGGARRSAQPRRGGDCEPVSVKQDRIARIIADCLADILDPGRNPRVHGSEVVSTRANVEAVSRTHAGYRAGHGCTL